MVGLLKRVLGGRTRRWRVLYHTRGIFSGEWMPYVGVVEFRDTGRFESNLTVADRRLEDRLGCRVHAKNVTLLAVG